mmetsp:Transcript_32771/g.45501  ORF Transcript_32771/g.45501 Transcript_32771/m.45501 type:complete len:212 (-) Transcript_32771:539-1174(-)
MGGLLVLDLPALEAAHVVLKEDKEEEEEEEEDLGVKEVSCTSFLCSVQEALKHVWLQKKLCWPALAQSGHSNLPSTSEPQPRHFATTSLTDTSSQTIALSFFFSFCTSVFFAPFFSTSASISFAAAVDTQGAVLARVLDGVSGGEPGVVEVGVSSGSWGASCSEKLGGAEALLLFFSCNLLMASAFSLCFALFAAFADRGFCFSSFVLISH